MRTATIIVVVALTGLGLLGCNSKEKCLEQCRKQAAECTGKTGDALAMCTAAAKTCPKDLCDVE